MERTIKIWVDDVRLPPSDEWLHMYTVEGIKDTVCGKSGTAQIGGDRQNCWFSAFAPMEQPKIAVTSIVEDGDTGASVSRIDAAIIGAYLNE